MTEELPITSASSSLDPVDEGDWAALRSQGHAMLDDMLDYLQHRDELPLWQPMPDAVREGFSTAPVPTEAVDLAEVYSEFRRVVMPYVVGNTHPGFMGWVHGGGTAVGMLAEMLAAGLNANCGRI